MHVALAPDFPKPQLSARLVGARSLSVLTDEALFEATGVRLAFTGRAGGVSEGAYASLNLGTQVGDEATFVEQNRQILLAAFQAQDAALITANQVHGSNVVEVASATPEALDQARASALAGADALLVQVPQVAALMCFADCVPVILVAPHGGFSVVHAGWRGAVVGITGKAARKLAAHEADVSGVDVAVAARRLNAYIGPHIRSECFETGADVAKRFVARCGAAASPDELHVSLAYAVTADLQQAGVSLSRIADAGICTQCSSDQYFSYRAAGGTCGRHGAFAARQKG